MLTYTPMLSAQQIFNKVRDHLLAQNKQAARSDGSGCYLRSPDDPTLKCAVGCLINDEFFVPEAEGMFIQELCHVSGENYKLQYAGLMFSGVDPWKHGPLLRSLQTVHDGYPVAQWAEKLREMAIKYNLVP